MATKTSRKASTKSPTTAIKASTGTSSKTPKKRIAPPAISSPVTAKSEVALPAVSLRPKRGKLAEIIMLIEREEGATLIDLMAATGWQAHSVRGALSTLKKKLGQSLRITLNRDGLREYHLETQ